MRTIKFRGKLCHSKQWIEGNLIVAKNGQHYIIPSEFFEPDGHHLIIDSDNPFLVIPESVGQFTELTDKNGVKIFEGDIFKRILNKDKRFDLKDDFSDYWMVEWLNDTCGFTTTLIGELYDGKYTTKPLKRNSFSTRFNEADEIIGNIHDNPELIK